MVSDRVRIPIMFPWSTTGSRPISCFYVWSQLACNTPLVSVIFTGSLTTAFLGPNTVMGRDDPVRYYFRKLPKKL
jgi:hypothetical protein